MSNCKQGRFFKPKSKTSKSITHLKPFKPEGPLEGPIKLEVIWRFPKGKRYKHNEESKPDTDNLEKMLKV